MFASVLHKANQSRWLCAVSTHKSSFPFLRGISMGLFARKFFERFWFGGICCALRNLDNYVLRGERSSSRINSKHRSPANDCYRRYHYHNTLCWSHQNFTQALFLGVILTPKRNWRQCLFKILKWPIKSIMVSNCPRRDFAQRRNPEEAYLQFKYTVGILEKNLDLFEQGPRGIGR